MSGITAKEDISLSKEDIAESKVDSINTTKTLIFKHEANAGQLIIDTTNLNTPASSALNGFVQPDLSEVAALNLLVNKNNIKIHSSRGIWLQQHDEFKITGASTIQFVGSMEALGGAEEGEIFTVYATPVRANSYLTTDFKKQGQEYLLPAGQTLLSLGREFEVNRHPNSQLGAIRVSRKGIGPQLRNVGNAAASPTADGNFQEIDAGQGLGTSIQFNTADIEDNVVVVEFGVEYAGDFSMVGDIEALYGAILKLAEDVKDLGPYLISRYITANPSQVERRAFGDSVLSLLARMTAVESIYLRGGQQGMVAVSAYIQNNGTATILRQDGNWLQSVVRTGGGSTVGTYVPGYFAPGTIPNIVAIPKHLSGVQHMSADFQSISANDFNMFTPGVDGINRDTDYMIIAVGKKA